MLAKTASATNRNIPAWCADVLELQPRVLEGGIETEALGIAFLHRLLQDGSLGTNRSLIDLAHDLRSLLDHVLDLHWNRFSRARYANILAEIIPILGHRNVPNPGSVKDAVVVELGCGSWNPFGLGFALLLLGAAKAYVLDLHAPKNVAKAVRAMAEVAGMLLLDPGSIAGKYPVAREEILSNSRSFDLAKLARGDESGLDKSRLRHVLAPADRTPVAGSEADIVYSTSFLEHVLNLDEVLEELRRITKPGGIGYHGLDATDHRRYRLPGHGPLDYLAEEGRGEVVMYSESYGINRVRPHEFLRRFEEHGFEVVRSQVVEKLDPATIDRSRFVEPYRSMAQEDLAVLRMRIVVRKR